MSQVHSNPWKIATIAIVASFFAALASGVVVAKVQDARNQTASQPQEIAEEATPAPEPEVAALEPEPEEQQAAAPEPAPIVIQTAPPPQRSVENCERYLHRAHTNGGRVLKNGVIGGAVGAGLGAAGGAIGGSAGKGAGIGALAGAALGSGYTLHDEHRKKESARRAYEACLARNGY
jgi:uncharacterized membrane protein YraQ (UPF0718 family)